MTSRERVRAAIEHKQTDRLAKDFIATDYIIDKLIKHLGVKTYEDVLQHFDIDVRCFELNSIYNGKPLRKEIINGETVEETYWGYERKHHWTGQDFNNITTRFALEDDEELSDALDKYTFPNPDDFDYSKVTEWVNLPENKDRALCFGHAGAYQMAASNLRNTELLFMDMACDPDATHRLYDSMNDFLLAHYERALIAGEGKIDILRIHDDYGTQISTLFSVDMWEEYFKENLTKFVNLAHKYNCKLMQHSCGAIRPFLPGIISCGVDLLDPIQKVVGLEPEGLKADFGDQMTFHGGIDTQFLLPNATPEEVAAECEYYIKTLWKNGGYIFTASQHLQGDVPIENIIAMYETARKF